MPDLVPLTDKVIVKCVDGDKVSKGGIIIPDVAVEKPAKGVVIATGPGRLLSNGVREPTGVKQGDLVFYSAYRGTEIEVNGVRLLVLKAEDLFCVQELEEEPAELEEAAA